MTSNNAIAMLQLSLVRGVGPARMRKALNYAAGVGSELIELVSTRKLGDVLTLEQLDQLADTREACSALVERLQSLDALVTCITDPTYPTTLAERYGDRSPPLLFTRGNAELLMQPSVGFCGSREASERGLGVAKDCAAQLAANGIVVTSGFAAGVDMCAHTSALTAGGTTTIVLAEGIVGFRIKPEIASAWSWDRACVVSEFAPTAPWSASNAMQRNRTIIGLSRAMILIESRATGGSISAGRDALAARVPLFAADYEGMPPTAVGNRELLRQGARPLLRSQATQRASLEAVLSAVKTESDSNKPAAPQMSLFS